MSIGSDVGEHQAPTGRRSHLADSAPWIVLGSLLILGFAGGFGLLPIRISRPTAQPANEPTRPGADPVPSATRPKAGSDSPDSVVVRHLLVQPKGAWRAEKDNTFDSSQAKARAEEARAKLMSGEPFDKVLHEYSNNREIVSEGGVMPRLNRGDGMPGIGDAAFSLKVGGISKVVETPFGFHVLQRTE